MRRNILSIALILSQLLPLKAQVTKWEIDKAHSSIHFDISHMVVSEVEGQFKEFDGTILSDKSDFTDAKIDLTIDAKSISTDNEKRDNHLRGKDFFDVEAYPQITFKSKSFKLTGNNLYRLTGDFTMHGVSREVTLDVTYGGTIKDPRGNTRTGFKVSGKINRMDYGVKYNSVMEGGGFVVGEDVTIDCKIELVKQR